MRLVIIEDEQPAIENLLVELNNTGKEYETACILKSVQESISWFNHHDGTHIDLVFMDIHLADGVSFNIFKEVNITIPVIFTTGHDEYLQTSLEYNGIDYLLKPVNHEKLRQSINKFNNLKSHFTVNYREVFSQPLNGNDMAIRNRIVVKKGIEFQSIKAEDVAYFYTEHKLIFLVDRDGKKYMAQATNLTDLMAQLNKRLFYRANRKYIVNINFIRKYRPYEKVKLELELSVPASEEIIISQENSGGFKSWIESL